MPLQDTTEIYIATTTAAESLPDPTLVAARTHWLINASSLVAVYSSIGATPFQVNGVNVATVSIPAGAHISVRSDGVHWVITDGADSFQLANPTVTVPARALNSTFTPNATRPTLVTYSIQISCSAALLAGQSGRVELRSDPAGAAVTVRASVRNSLVPGILTALGDVTVQRAPITWLVPAGWGVQLATVNETGTPTYAISNQSEETL